MKNPGKKQRKRAATEGRLEAPKAVETAISLPVNPGKKKRKRGATEERLAEPKAAETVISLPAKQLRQQPSVSPVGALLPERFVVPLPVKCVYYDEGFLSRAEATQYLELLSGDGINWAESFTSRHPTALYGDAGTDYRGPRRKGSDLPGFGYASDVMNKWTPTILELKHKAEQWYLKHTGQEVSFSAALINRYEGGQEFLGWHSDREELDPQIDAPRSSPIASISLGAERRFGFRRKTVLEKDTEYSECDPISLSHGSLCVMENACQFLYQHSLLPEHKKNKKAKRVRVNLTFRSHRPTTAATKSTVFDLAIPVPAVEKSLLAKPKAAANSSAIFVGLTPGKDHTPKGPKGKEGATGFKQMFHHPFETPFANDNAEDASLRYFTWLTCQPLFHSWVCNELRGRQLEIGSEKKKFSKDMAHARVLARLSGALAPVDSRNCKSKQ